MLGLTADMRQKSLVLPFQTQILKTKPNQTTPKAHQKGQIKLTLNQWNKIYIVSIK